MWLILDGVTRFVDCRGAVVRVIRQPKPASTKKPTPTAMPKGPNLTLEDIFGTPRRESKPDHVEINTAVGSCVLEFAAGEELDRFVLVFEKSLAGGKTTLNVTELGLHVTTRFEPREVDGTQNGITLLNDEPIAVRVVNELNDPVPVTDV